MEVDSLFWNILCFLYIAVRANNVLHLIITDLKKKTALLRRD